jgi:hypothetical protein
LTMVAERDRKESESKTRDIFDRYYASTGAAALSSCHAALVN